MFYIREKSPKQSLQWGDSWSLTCRACDVTRDEYGKAYEKDFQYTVRFLMSRGAHRDAATELAQAAWARGWEQLSQLRNESFLRVWISTIALNLFRGGLRAERPLCELHDTSVTQINLAAIDIAQILQSCSPRDQALLLRHMYGFTVAEIAHRENLTDTAVRIRLMRARRAARVQVIGSARTQRIRALAMTRVKSEGDSNVT